jgi:hypothetical protein
MMKQRNWMPATKVDLMSLEDRLPAGKKLVTAWLPDRGACYMIVNSSKPHYKTTKSKVIY